MCSLVFTALDRDADESASARPGQRTDGDLAAVLRAFFQNRLRAGPGHAGRVRLLIRRTLARVARRATASPGDARRPQKADVLRAALVELQRLDAPAAPQSDDRIPIPLRN